jgi:hypothetical protein
MIKLANLIAGLSFFKILLNNSTSNTNVAFGVKYEEELCVYFKEMKKIAMYLYRNKIRKSLRKLAVIIESARQ